MGVGEFYCNVTQIPYDSPILSKQWCLVHSGLGTITPMSEHFHHLRKLPWVQYQPLTNPLPHSLIYFVSLDALILTFHTDAITWSFDRHLSCSVMYGWTREYFTVRISHFCSSIFQLMDVGVVATFWPEWVNINIHVQGFVWTCFNFS